MPKKVRNEDEIPTLVLSGKMISIRTSVVMDEMLEDFIADASVRELRHIDRTEAARRLLAVALQRWWSEFMANGGIPGGDPPGTGSEVTPLPSRLPKTPDKK